MLAYKKKFARIKTKGWENAGKKSKKSRKGKKSKKKAPRSAEALRSASSVIRSLERSLARSVSRPRAPSAAPSAASRLSEYQLMRSVSRPRAVSPPPRRPMTQTMSNRAALSQISRLQSATARPGGLANIDIPSLTAATIAKLKTYARFKKEVLKITSKTLNHIEKVIRKIEPRVDLERMIDVQEKIVAKLRKNKHL